MSSLFAPSRDGTDEAVQAVLKQRSRPCVLVLDHDLNIAFADPHALALLETHLLQEQIGELVRRCGEKTEISEDVIRAVEGLIVRVVPLSGTQGCFYAIVLEKEARREDLRDAVARFSLSPREVEVLEMILSGMKAAEIASTLHIAEVTVFDHFKHITLKTNARNRADMVGKVFNWQAALKRRRPR